MPNAINNAVNMVTKGNIEEGMKTLLKELGGKRPYLQLKKFLKCVDGLPPEESANFRMYVEAYIKRNDLPEDIFYKPTINTYTDKKDLLEGIRNYHRQLAKEKLQLVI